jgi:hypothetical protein
MALKKGSWRTGAARVSEELKRTDLALMRRAGLGPQLATMSRQRRGRWLRSLRELASLFARAPKERRARVAWLRKELPSIFKQLPIDPADLGARNSEELLRIFLRMMERVDLRKTYATAAELKRAARGFRSTPRGELFELLTDNLRQLRKFYLETATSAHRELNELMAAMPHRLRDGRNKAVTVRGRFAAKPLYARDFTIKLKGDVTPKKFIDRAQLSPLEALPGGRLDQPYFGVLTAMELKTRGAAKRGFNRQIGRILPRMAAPEAEYIECVIDGLGRRRLNPDQFLYSQRVKLVGVTHPEAGQTPMVGWRMTDRGGYDESYLHYEIDVKLSKINYLVDLLFPVGSRKR